MSDKAYVTYVFEITDAAKWGGNPNPLYRDQAVLPGLKCVGIAAGDLMALSDDFQERDEDAYEESYKNNIKPSVDIMCGGAST